MDWRRGAGGGGRESGVRYMWGSQVRTKATNIKAYLCSRRQERQGGGRLGCGGAGNGAGREGEEEGRGHGQHQGEQEER